MQVYAKDEFKDTLDETIKQTGLFILAVSLPS